jgi:hypothetical protein
MEKLKVSYQISFEIVKAEGGRWVKKQEFGSQFVLRIICLLRNKHLFPWIGTYINFKRQIFKFHPLNWVISSHNSLE